MLGNRGCTRSERSSFYLSDVVGLVICAEGHGDLMIDCLTAGVTEDSFNDGNFQPPRFCHCVWTRYLRCSMDNLDRKLRGSVVNWTLRQQTWLIIGAREPNLNHNPRSRRLGLGKVFNVSVSAQKVSGSWTISSRTRRNVSCRTSVLQYKPAWLSTSWLKPNTHRRRRRDETVLSCRVGVGGVYMNSQVAHDDCRRIRRCERSRRPWPSLQFCS